jgi:REP element-mobilizing transposase RayT
VGPHGRAGKPLPRDRMLQSDPDWKHGRPPRLRGHNYSGSAGYFITINTMQRIPLFGSCCAHGVILSEYGRIVEQEWLRTQILRLEVSLDSFVIMPDHFHGILFLTAGHEIETRSDRPRGAESFRRAPRSLGSLIAGFKSSATKRINLFRGTPGAVVWQSNYHERVIRTDKELARLREYVVNNPLRKD